MKKLTICLLLLLTVLACSGCSTVPEAVPPFELALDDCNVTIQDRITREVYYTARGYYSQLDSSRIQIRAGYKLVRNSLGVRIGTKPIGTPIILSGNWSLTRG